MNIAVGVKKLLSLVAVAAVAAVVSSFAAAQSDAAGFKAAYDRQVKNVGLSGIGVQTIIERWERLDANDLDMLEAKFSYYYAKSRRTEVVPKSKRKYLGQKPMLTLKDTLGNDVFYFEEPVFTDSLFAKGMTSIGKAISLSPKELRYRFYEISSLMDYEKESPDLAVEKINSLIDEYQSDKSGWTLDAQEAGDDVVCQAVGEYCYNLFNIASESSYEYFLKISEKMNKLYPSNTVFIDNIGTYYQVAQHNDKKAVKYYKKALKIDPEDYAALTNMRIIRSSQLKKDRSSK